MNIWKLTASLVPLTLLVGCNSSTPPPDSGTGATTSTKPATSDGTASASAGGADTALHHADAGKKLVVGFSQIGAESAWRTANTKSIQDEAAKRSIDLKFSDAQQKQENQIKAIQSFIDQKVDVIAFAPVVESGWGPILQKAKDAHIPVFVSDRRPDVPEDMYVCFMGADFVKEGKMAADWLIKKTGGKAVIAELEGTTGSAPANDRKKGFDEEIKANPDMKVVYSQTGDFKREKGKSVTEAFLKTPDAKDVNVLFAHNDDMAIGAIQALEEAGRHPGKDVVVLSIDGIKDAFQAIADGKMNCTTECNPLLGPLLFDTIEKWEKGGTVEKRIIVPDGQFDETTAKAELPNRKY